MSDTFRDSVGDTWHRGGEIGTVTLAGLIFRFGTAGRLEVRQQYRVWEYVRNMPHFSQGAREAIAALWPETERPNSTTPLPVAAPTPRRIIQLTASGKSLAALCSDDSVWIITDELCWMRLPTIPQGDQ